MCRSCSPAPVRYYYDLVYSPDDGGWYADLVSSDGEVCYQTAVSSKNEVIAAVKAVYPFAELLNTFA